MNTYVAKRWILVAGALLLAVMLWGTLLTNTASAQAAPTGGPWGTPGAMGSHMGYGPGATTWMTGTTGMMGMYGMGTGMMAPMGGMMGTHGMMGGMMGMGGHPCGGYGVSGAMMPGMTAQGATSGAGQAALSISAEKALTLAQEYVKSALPDAQAGEAATQVWGGYSVPLLRDGQPIGMLFVDGYSGQVWSHR